MHTLPPCQSPCMCVCARVCVCVCVCNHHVSSLMCTGPRPGCVLPRMQGVFLWDVAQCRVIRKFFGHLQVGLPVCVCG